MDTKAKFMQILNEIVADATMESKTENLLINSITFIKLIVKLEEVFSVQFEDETLNKTYFLRIEDIFNYIEENINNKLMEN